MTRIGFTLSSLIAALVLLATGCTRVDAASPAGGKPAAQPGPAAIGALPRLVFFINPNGMPCQMQDRILQGMSGELAGKVEVVRYRTTDQVDLVRFQQYGIRSLPALVLTDASGRELRRASPGIQQAEQIRQLIAR